jgi:heme exporter protein C
MKVIDRLLIAAGTRSAQRRLGWATLAGLAATAVLGLVVVPPDAAQGDVQRLMYIHVPAAWLAYLSFGVVFVASLAYLRTGRIRWDRVAVASAEIGVLFCVLTLVLGSLWGRPVWGTWWTWDPRLTTTVVLLLVYVGYLSLRSVADSPSRRAHWSAVVGVVGFVDVPIVHMSVVWWRSLHQEATVIRPGAPTMDTSMLIALLVGTAAFSIAYGYLMAVRLRVGRLEDHAATAVMSQPTPRAKAPRPVVVVSPPVASPPVQPVEGATHG